MTREWECSMTTTTQRYLTVALVALAVTALALLAPTAFAQQDDEGAITSTRQQWQEAYNAGDVTSLADLYTEDAALYDADGRVAEGRDAIRAHLEQETAEANGGRPQVALEPIEMLVDGDTAYDLGRYTLTSAAGEAAEGHYLVILRRVDGEWLIHRQIANLILPEGEMGAPGGGAGGGG